MGAVLIIVTLLVDIFQCVRHLLIRQTWAGAGDALGGHNPKMAQNHPQSPDHLPHHHHCCRNNPHPHPPPRHYHHYYYRHQHYHHQHYHYIEDINNTSMGRKEKTVCVKRS